MKKLFLILTLISLTPLVSAMDNNQSVEETQQRICRENQLRARQNEQEADRIRAARKMTLCSYGICCVIGYCLAKVAMAHAQNDK